MSSTAGVRLQSSFAEPAEFISARCGDAVSLRIASGFRPAAGRHGKGWVLAILGRARPARGSGPALAPFAAPACCQPRPAAPEGNTEPDGLEGQMCKVLNKHTAGSHEDAVYIGRGSKWGNPFRIGIDGDRAAVIAKYERWLRSPRLMNCAAAICCAFARQKHVTAICCCGLTTRRARSASHGGARILCDRDRQVPSGGPSRHQTEDRSAQSPTTSFPAMSRRWLTSCA